MSISLANTRVAGKNDKTEPLQTANFTFSQPIDIIGMPLPN
ncbi:MAG: hypothetical protein ACYDG2_13785 [Ruminiclostridium sp.]